MIIYGVKNTMRFVRVCVMSMIGCAVLTPLCQQARACDFCNCLLGINPYYSSSNSIVLNFMYQRSDHPGQEAAVALPDAAMSGPIRGTPNRVYHGGEEGVASTEYRRTLELGYQHHFGDDFLVTALMPLISFTEQSDSRLSVLGNGDLSLFGQYIARLYDEGGARFTMLTGGGLQFPTGRTGMTDDDGELLDFRLQPGSGSFGFILAATAFYQTPDWMLTLDLFGKLNLKNGSGNHLGNGLAGGLMASRELYRDNPSAFAVIASLGVRSEFIGRDLLDGAPDPDTGATVHYVNCGALVAYDVLRVDLRALIPLTQHRNGVGGDEQTRFITSLRFVF